MTRLGLSRELRRSGAAVLGVAGLVVGAVAAMGTPASAAEGDLTATMSFSCVTKVGSSNNSFTWSNAQITLNAKRPVGTTNVYLTATVSDMPGIAPVQMTGFQGTDELVLDVDGTARTLKGSGSITNTGPNQPVPMPALALEAPLTSSATSLTVSVTSVQLVVSGITTDCTTPTPTGSMGAPLTIVAGNPPAPTPTATTTTSATATPTPSASASATASPSATASAGGKSKGKPAKGDVDFACVLNPLGTEFDYPATISVAGARAKAADDLALSATMSDLPGISPVPIDGQMDVTLDLVVGAKAATLTGTTTAVAAAKAPVDVPTLSGEVAVDGDELDVAVTGFTFTFAALSIDAECESAKTSLSAMKVGSEPLDDGSDSNSDGGSGSDSGSGSGGLPQTGGGDAMPVVALWAVALSLLGAALLLIVPGSVRRKA